MTENTENKPRSSGLSKLNLALIIIIAIILIDNEGEQSRALQFLHQFITAKYRVDFTVPEIQQIDNTFLLSSASQEKHLTGIKYSGRIINTQSVDHLNAAFNLDVDGKSKGFTINKISSGNSTGFNVYIPELNIENARYAKIEYVRSQIQFYTK